MGVGVIFYAHKGVRTSSATVLRYVTVYVACKMLFEMTETAWRGEDMVDQLNEAAVIIGSHHWRNRYYRDVQRSIIAEIIGLVLNICLGIHYLDVFRSLGNELGKSQ